MQKFVIFTVAALFMVAGCGGSKTKLTSEQKAEFADTLESAGRAQKVGKTGAQTSGRFSAIEGSTRSSSSQKDIEAQMYSKLQSADCDFKFSEPQSFDAGSSPMSALNQKMEWSVEGNSCPLVMNFSFTTTTSGQTENDFKMKMAMDMNFTISDEELKKLNDVYAMTLKGEITADKNGANGSFDGKIKSVTHGDIPVSMKISGSKDSAEVSYNVDMPKYSVEMKMTVSKDGKPEYTLNGEKMTEQEFQDLMSKGGEGFTAAQQGGTKKQTTSSSSPSHSGHSHDDGDEDPFDFSSHH